jgi:tetratricopeptide (TPR) repeat protein
LYAQKISDQGFADHLFKEKEYYRAITEYYRLSYNYTDPTKKTDLFRKIGLCHYYGADYEGYISFLEKNQNYFESNTRIRTEMNLYLGKSYYQLNHYQKAINTIEWRDMSPDTIFSDEIHLFLAIAYAREFDWQTALKKIQLIESDSPQKTVAENISRSLRNFSDLPQKKPFWAGFLSAIIPGSGYIYCDRVGTGISSLLVNGLLIWAISDAIRQEQYGIAATAGFFGIGWYIGNITGSVEAANVYNTHIRNEFVNKILEQEDLHEYIKD